MSRLDTTTQWLIKQPIFVAFALFNYLYFVLKCGPDFMRNRPAYELRLVMLAYNAIQVVVNIWLAVYVSYINCTTLKTLMCIHTTHQWRLTVHRPFAGFTIKMAT